MSAVNFMQAPMLIPYHPSRTLSITRGSLLFIISLCKLATSSGTNASITAHLIATYD